MIFTGVLNFTYLVFLFFNFFFFNIYLFLRDRERDHKQGRRRIQTRLQASSCQHRAQRGARTHGP